MSRARASSRLLEPPPGRYQLLVGGLHLAALWSFAIVQPLFDVLSDSPDFFVARGNGRADILIFALGLVFVPPLIAIGIEGLVRLVSPTAQRLLHLFLIGLLAAALALGAVNGLGAPAGWLLAAAVLVGALVAIAYALSRFVPSLLTVLGLAPIVFIALFLVGSPVSKLVLPQESVAAAQIAVPKGNPVVVLVVDELPVISLLDGSGRIDASRFPNFAELAGSSTWYRNATTVADLTPQAVPAILTGDGSASSALPIAADHPENLFTLLGGSYRLEVNESATSLCPEGLCDSRASKSLGHRLSDLVSDLSIVSGRLLVPDSIAAGLPPVTETFGDFGGADTVGPGDEAAIGESTQGEAAGAAERKARKRALQAAGGRASPLQSMVAEIDGRNRTLYFAHVELPHLPWEYLPNGARYAMPEKEPFDSSARGASIWSKERWVSRNAYQRHLLQLGFVDRLLGDVVDRMREEGIWSRSLVAVVADHGASFQPDRYRRVATEGNLATIANVPMFIKRPGQGRGEVVDGTARTTDVLPTIAAALDVEIPYEVQGAALPAAARASRGPVYVHNRFGQRVTEPLSKLARTRDQIARRLARDYGAGGGWASLYSAGPHSELIGSSVADRLQPGAGGSLELDRDPSTYLDRRPEDDVVPALLSGSLQATAGEDVGVAVNGRVAAIGRTYSSGGETRLIAMVPPDAYRQGANEVQILAIEPGGRLRELAAAG